MIHHFYELRNVMFLEKMFMGDEFEIFGILGIMS